MPKSTVRASIKSLFTVILKKRTKNLCAFVRNCEQNVRYAYFWVFIMHRNSMQRTKEWTITSKEKKNRSARSLVGRHTMHSPKCTICTQLQCNIEIYDLQFFFVDYCHTTTTLRSIALASARWPIFICSIHVFTICFLHEAIIYICFQFERKRKKKKFWGENTHGSEIRFSLLISSLANGRLVMLYNRNRFEKLISNSTKTRNMWIR